MRKITRKLVLAVAGLLTISAAAGCGQKKIALEDYPSTVVATLGDTKIYLDEANYKARADQYLGEMYYGMAGYDLDTMWHTDIGIGTTMEEYSKTTTMTGIYQTCVLKAKAEELGLSLDEAEKAKVEETVKTTMEDMDPKLQEVTKITEERMREIVTDNALAMKAYEYAVKDVDTVVTDEEASQRTISYILVKDEEDAEAAKALAEELEGKVKAGEDMEALADEKENCTYAQVTYGRGDYGNKLDEFGFTLKTGETGKVYDEGYGWYVVYCDTEFDAEATEQEKGNIVDERKGELFQTAYTEWLKDMPDFKVEEKVWAQVIFDKALYEAPESTEETETTEAAGSEGTSEAAGETETSAAE